MCTFQPEHLLVKEVDYELRIREIEVEESAKCDKKRSLLRGALKQEQGNRSFRQISAAAIPFLEQQQGINETLEDLTQKINNFRGTVHDSMYSRYISRLAHISGRVHLLCCSDEEQQLYKRSMSIRILSLEGELDSRVNPLATSTPVSSVQASNSLLHPKPVQVHKWGVSFSGEGHYDQVISFLDRVECLRVSRGVSEEDLFSASAELFTSHAFTWFMNNRGSFTTWTDLAQKLKSDFLPYSFQTDLLDEIKNRKQKPGESVTMFINTMLGMCSRLDTPLTDHAKIKIILKCLLPFYHAQLALVDIATIEDLTEKCKRLEETLSWSLNSPTTSQFNSGPVGFNSQPSRNRSWQSRPHTPNVSVTTYSLSCWNCQVVGHTFRDCTRPQTRIFCHGCGRENTLKRNCFKCSGNEHAEARTLSVPQTATPSGNMTAAVDEASGPIPASSSNTPSQEGRNTSNRRPARQPKSGKK
ncbi:uncharacterized protein LOC126888142 [Diabrotica virgifera virgifera]|uniref:Retrotransposon gag domain-containing protein n=1 Tax=Diabrotica virgifera virgifera TaxID=50390 RepID=A0ABM5KPI5_DIAVI|nr:uncharacterized protein LOC126888142 [Diabrotica virgifera virgifera]